MEKLRQVLSLPHTCCIMWHVREPQVTPNSTSGSPDSTTFLCLLFEDSLVRGTL